MKAKCQDLNSLTLIQLKPFYNFIVAGSNCAANFALFHKRFLFNYLEDF